MVLLKSLYDSHGPFRIHGFGFGFCFRVRYIVWSHGYVTQRTRKLSKQQRGQPIAWDEYLEPKPYSFEKDYVWNKAMLHRTFKVYEYL